MAGVSLGGAISSKWVGAFIVAFTGLRTVCSTSENAYVVHSICCMCGAVKLPSAKLLITHPLDGMGRNLSRQSTANN